MKSERDFLLTRGISFFLTEKNKKTVLEFSLHPDPLLDNIVEIWEYSAKKVGPEKSQWLILDDFFICLSFNLWI